MTAAELESAVRERSLSPQAFLDAYAQVSKGTELEVRTYPPGAMSLYRTKSLKGDKPEDVQDVSYPPVEKCEMQRANVEGEQVFYASSKLPATMTESRVEKGEKVVVSKWKNRVELRVRVIPTDYESGSAASVTNLLFTDEDTSIYPYSSLFAHALFSSDPHTGLLYPSRLNDEENDNIALTKVATDELLELVHASVYEVIEAEPGGSFKVHEVDFALPEGSKLIWKGRARTWPKSEGELRQEWNGWGYACFDAKGNEVEPE
jgi:hypothetical protein